jgi:hypothetical protein
MTDSPELADARKRIEELERMLDTFHAVGADVSPSVAKLDGAHRMDRPAARTRRKDYASIQHIDGDPTNNDISNLRIIPLRDNR